MDAYRNPALPIPERALDLISRMTPEEKLSQLSFDAPAVPRLGVRAWTWWNEASHGVISVFQSFDEATSFPVCLALANTWDPEMAEAVGAAISDEARAIYNLTGKELDYWCPTVNMGRDPRWGRNDEAFGEDPLLAGKLAAAYVRGMQGTDPLHWKTISTPKHFAANNTEFNRNSSSSDMDEATLREYYLPVFERCFREGGAHAVMTAYNRISGVPCSANEHLLQDILRDEWGFEGYVVSDDGAVGDVGPNTNTMWGQPRGHFYARTMPEASALSLNAGTDLCCGNDYRVWLKQALDEGLTDWDTVDRALVRLFTARFSLGEFDPKENSPWFRLGAEDVCSAEHAAIALKAAEESAVLLKNERELLPLRPEAGKKILVIGPNAIYRQLGSYSIGGYADTRVSVTPLQGIRALAAGHGFSVEYRKGWHICDHPIEDGSHFPILDRAAADNGMTTEEYLEVRVPEPVQAHNRALAARRAERAQLPPPVPRHPVDDPDLGRADNELWQEALAAAGEADIVVVIAGTDPSVTSEGRDRASLALPYDQDGKLRELAAVNPNTAAVLITSGPVTGGFLDAVPAVLWAPYGGESQGTAIAKLLFGEISPSGRTCETWVRSEADLPPITDYGIRPLDTATQLGRTYAYFLGKPRYAFGHGLSYSSFRYSGFRLSAAAYSPDDEIACTFTLENTGSCAAAETVQLYGFREGLWQNLPYRRLLAFRKVFLQPGEKREITLSLPASDLKLWYAPGRRYLVPEGIWHFRLAASSEGDAIAESPAEIRGSWTPPLAAATLRCPKRILAAGSSAELSVTAVLEDASRIAVPDAELTVSDPAVGEVSGRVFRAKQPGLCTVTLRVRHAGGVKESALPLLVE